MLYYILNKVIHLTDLHGRITGQMEPSLAAEIWGAQLQGKNKSNLWEGVKQSNVFSNVKADKKYSLACAKCK